MESRPHETSGPAPQEPQQCAYSSRQQAAPTRADPQEQKRLLCTSVSTVTLQSPQAHSHLSHGSQEGPGRPAVGPRQPPSSVLKTPKWKPVISCAPLRTREPAASLRHDSSIPTLGNHSPPTSTLLADTELAQCVQSSVGCFPTPHDHPSIPCPGAPWVRLLKLSELPSEGAYRPWPTWLSTRSLPDP